MKVVLAEKPSVARDLAVFLRANSRHDGYWQGGDYQVTWAFGHLVELKEPGDYDPSLKRWTLESLPFVPDEFELRLRGDDGARKQFAIIERLFRSADSLICATDAGREGELIFRYILSLTRCEHKPAERLWLSSLTPSAIAAAFRSIRPLSDYDNLYAAAKCRSEADWIVGLNATRNYTVRYRSIHSGTKTDKTADEKKLRRQSGLLWSLGRVQTPVLAMIVRRDDEIRTFRSEPFWELLTKYRNVQFRFTGDRFEKEDEANRRLEAIKPHPLKITKVSGRTEKSPAPQLYDLTELQRDMNRRFGMSAADTLAVAQSLYESKLITYPRTDSRYLSKDMRKDIPKVLAQLKTYKPAEIDRLNLQSLSFSSRIINDAKITDHHAIIPTGSNPASLNDRQRKVYEAIVIRFIAAFYPACEKQITTVDAVADKTVFRARGIRVVVAGWTQLYPKENKKSKQAGDESGEPQTLPAFKQGESGPHRPFIKSGQTSAPKHFTENTLLGAMDTAGKLVDEAERREALKEKGLGTPATRAATIETLLHRNYIQRSAKHIIATDLGRYLVAIVKDANLTSPELTGEWEAKLKQIEMGGLHPDVFMDQIAEYTRSIVRSDDVVQSDSDIYGDCPLCGKEIMKGNKALGCSRWRDGCKFVLSPEYRGVSLTMTMLRELLQLGVASKPIVIDDERPVLLGMSRSGVIVEIPVPRGDEQDTAGKQSGRSKSKSSSPRKKSTTTGSVAKHPTSDSIGKCPLCQSPVVETPKAYSCSRWREGCDLTIWKTISGRKISVTHAKKLLQSGKTPMIKGFKSKAGKKFDARLKLVDGKVSFDFGGASEENLLK